MAEAPQFSPDELDRLEDALESIEDVDLDLIEDESEAVRGRMVEYRHILALSREALPIEEVPAGILDSVLAVARDPASDDLGVVGGQAAQPKQSWWTRFRKTLLLPSLAVAGSAALILLIVQPTTGDLSPVVASAEKQADANKDDGAAPPPPAAAAEQAGSPEPEPEAVEEDVPADEAPLREIATSRASTAAQPSTPAEVAAIDSPVETKSGEKGRAEADPSSIVEEDAEGGEGRPPRWDLIARGDRARRDGDCATARSEYELALSDPDDRVRSRANAGLGMCEAKRGRWSAAEELYEQARNLDPEVDSFIGAERPKGAEAPAAKPRPSSKKKRSKRKSADFNDPFGE